MANFTIIITALDETWSVHETINTIVGENGGDIADIIVATAPHTTAECRQAISEMEKKYPTLVRQHEQSRLPGLGGAIQECVDLVNTDWMLFVSADLETPPDKVKDIIARAKQDDVDIVATSRWIAGGGFGNYAFIKLLCNWVFQKFFSLLYLTPLTDMTYGFRAYRTTLLRRYHWRETGHAFFLESLAKPLRTGARVTEVPVQWSRRREGESHIKLSEFARYFRAGFVIRITNKKEFLK